MTALKTYFSNAAETTLSAGLGVGVTTANVAATASFPAAPFYVVIEPADDSQREVALATAKTATTLTLTRGQDGTTDVAHDSGAAIKLVPTAAVFNDLHDRIDATDASLVTDHGSLTGLADDDHTQYLNAARHDTHDHSTALGTASISDLADVDLAGIAAGSVLYYNGTNVVDLGIGSPDQVLAVNAGATAPEWVDASGGTQVETGTYTGNGVSPQNIPLTMTTPRLVLIVNETDNVANSTADGALSFFVSPLGGGVVDIAFLISGGALTGRSPRDILLSTSAFQVLDNANLSGKTFRYVAFGEA